jgi:hypothetical protein
MTTDGLPPNVRVDVARDKLLLFVGEGRGWQVLIHLVHYKNLDVSLRLLFFPKAIEFCKPSLE